MFLKAWITDYMMTDQNDESLRKWKESLGIGSGTTIGDASDPRKVIIVSLGLEVRQRS
jgi:Rho GDP-dissociation inhibitor